MQNAKDQEPVLDGKGKKEFTTTYYFQYPRVPTNKCCRQAFECIWNIGKKQLDNHNKKLWKKQAIKHEYKHSGKNQHGSNLSKEDMERVRSFIESEVPKRPGHYKGQDELYVTDEFDTIYTHEMLHKKYLERAQEKGWRAISLSEWKRLWYSVLKIKLKFLRPKQNVCDTCSDLKAKIKARPHR